MDVPLYGMQLYGCRGPLNDAERLSEVLHAAARRVGANVVEEARASFQPHGVTVVLVLAESHILLATWPEHGYAMLDLMLCNPTMRPEDAAAVVSEALLPREVRPWTITHHVAERPAPE